MNIKISARIISIILYSISNISLWAAPTRAEIIESIGPFGNPTGVTIDTLSNLEWLDLPASRGVTPETYNLLCSGNSVFCSYRLATRAEVTEFISHAVVMINGRLSAPSALAFLNLVGVTRIDGGLYSYGLIEEGTYLALGYEVCCNPRQEGAYIFERENGVLESSHKAAWLVRELPVDVDEPPILLIIIGSIAILIATQQFHRRQFTLRHAFHGAHGPKKIKNYGRNSLYYNNLAPGT